MIPATSPAGLPPYRPAICLNRFSHFCFLTFRVLSTSETRLIRSEELRSVELMQRGEETTEVVDGVVEVPETCWKPTFGSRPHFQEPAVLSKTFAI